MIPNIVIMNNPVFHYSQRGGYFTDINSSYEKILLSGTNYSLFWHIF